MTYVIFYNGKFYNYFHSNEMSEQAIKRLARRLGLRSDLIEVREYEGFDFKKDHIFEGKEIVSFIKEEAEIEVEELNEETKEIEKRIVVVNRMRQEAPLSGSVKFEQKRSTPVVTPIGETRKKDE